LIFDNNPIENPSARDSTEIQDVNDGKCYIEAYDVYCEDPSKDVLCPLILFIDKTHTDAKGNQTLEPVCFTLGIFNQKTRNQESAWRTIGFIPSMDVVSNRKLNSEEKQQDYHALLNVILSPLVELQQFKGLEWDLCFKETVYKVSLKIPVLFITGDSEGQDKLVGRRLQYSNLSSKAHICRYCNVLYHQTNDPFFKPGKQTKASKIKEYLDKQNPILNEIGYLNIKRNAFHNLKFCDTDHGLNGSVPADLLHTFQLGIYIYAIDGLFGQKKSK
jgi:hypothetical protein